MKTEAAVLERRWIYCHPVIVALTEDDFPSSIFIDFGSARVIFYTFPPSTFDRSTVVYHY